MRHRVALVSMALGIVAAGNAQANDATQVIYDLSALKNRPVAAPMATARSPELRLPSTSLPLATPSRDGVTHYSGDDLEFNPPRNHRRGFDGAARGGNGKDPGNDRDPGNNQDPTPNPEPGTMLLLGSALASGARFVRRRRGA